jgi:hypothetical protein
MRALPVLALGGLLLLGGAAGAADEKPVRELEPVHVNAMRDPEVRKYKAILAGLDAFDKHHALAPAVAKLAFHASPRQAGADASAAPLAARLAGKHDFSLALPIDANGLFTVPRSDEAEDADSELELNRKRKAYRVAPYIRTPGLPANQRRMGDLRLECKVMVAIVKEEIPFMANMLINGFLRTTDWCGFFADEGKKTARFGFHSDGPVTAAVLREGGRSLNLQSSGRSFNVPIGSKEWSDDAVVELTFADAATADAPRGTP